MHEIGERIQEIKEMAKTLNFAQSSQEGAFVESVLDLMDDIEKALSFLEEQDIRLTFDYLSDGDVSYICPNCETLIEVPDDADGALTCPKCKNEIIISPLL